MKKRKDGRQAGPLETIAELTRAWKRKDAAGMSRCLTDDITEIGPAFPAAIRGRDEFFRKYRSYLEGPTRIASYRVLDPRVHELSRDCALVHFRYRMRTVTRGREERSRGKESFVLMRERGRWRARFIHWHRDP